MPEDARESDAAHSRRRFAMGIPKKKSIGDEIRFHSLASCRLCVKSLGILIVILLVQTTRADEALLKKHCSQCHDSDNVEGKFKISSLGQYPSKESTPFWFKALDRVSADEMPPKDDSTLSKSDRKKLTAFLKRKLVTFRDSQEQVSKVTPRRLNNREFKNSVRDVLMIEDIGTHQPTDNLIGDSLHEGFDAHAETLGFSKFHLEQYIAAVRKIVDATILSGERPKSTRYEIDSTENIAAHTSQNTRRPERRGRKEGFDFLDPKQLAYFKDFKTVSQTGRYRITIRCIGKDRGLCDSKKTGIYDGDPIRLNVRMGDRERVILPTKR